MKILGSTVCALALALGTAAVVSAPADAAATKFANCTALNRAYPHGVAKKKGVRDRVKGSTKPVTTYTVNAKVYAANTKSDRDKDGIACEKR